MTRCPSCNHLVVYNAGDGRLKIRNRMLVVEKGQVQVACKRCGEDVPLDLTPGDELEKAMGSEPKRLVLGKTAKPLDAS